MHETSVLIEGALNLVLGKPGAGNRSSRRPWPPTSPEAAIR